MNLSVTAGTEGIGIFDNVLRENLLVIASQLMYAKDYNGGLRGATGGG